MRKKHEIGLTALVLGIAAAAILSWTLMAHRQPQPPEPLTAMLQGVAEYYGPGVGYEIHEWTDNEAWASIYLEAENERIPFENLRFRRVDDKWEVAELRLWPVPSPSSELAIVDYKVTTPSFDGYESLQFFVPVVKNSGRWPAFVASVELRLENSTNRYGKGYSTLGRGFEGIVPPRGTAEIWHGGGPVPSPYWYEYDNLPPLTRLAKTLLRMDLLEGKTFEVTITLRDGEGTVLAESTFTHTFTSRPSRIKSWMSVERFSITEEVFSPGPLGYSISVDITKPGENVTVRFYAWRHAVDLPGPVEFKLIQIDEEGNFVRVVDQENREIETVGSVRWRTEVPDLAPARYRFGVVIRDENGGVFAKLISTLYVPPQELNATISLNKEEFSSGDNLVYTICNEGPTHISFGTVYAIQYLHEGRWIPAEWVMPSIWAPMGIELWPGENYSHTVELFPVYAGTYRVVVDDVAALGTDLSTTLTATFRVGEGK